MEKWYVIGIKKNHEFKGNDGERVRGQLLFLANDAAPGSGVMGQYCREQFVSDRVQLSVEVGDQICIFFNRYGRIDSIEVAS